MKKPWHQRQNHNSTEKNRMHRILRTSVDHWLSCATVEWRDEVTGCVRCSQPEAKACIPATTLSMETGQAVDSKSKALTSSFGNPVVAMFVEPHDRCQERIRWCKCEIPTTRWTKTTGFIAYREPCLTFLDLRDCRVVEDPIIRVKERQRRLESCR